MEAWEDLKDRIPDVDVTPEETTGAALFGLGLVIGAMRVLRGERGWAGWIMPAGLMLSGISMLIDSTWDRRVNRISIAEERVREELAGLDPFARAQILKDVASEQLEPFTRFVESEE